MFNRPIGKNQAIQHPLAKNWMELEAAWLMTLSAAWQYDQGCHAAGGQCREIPPARPAFRLASRP